MSIKLIFYGPPGAGKDTQTEKLSVLLGVPSFSTGQLMRDAMAAGSAFGEEVRPYVESGTMVPKGVATQMYRERLLDPQLQASGYIVNGYPRSVESLQIYLSYDRPTAVIHLVIPDEAARQRLLSRGRTDDTPELIEKRLQRYHDTEQAAAEYVREQTDVPLIEVDGTLPVEEVTQNILDRIR